MSHQTYVFEIYQWVINDLVSKIRREFIEEGIDESVIKELKEIWEGRLFSMKICEAADILRHVYHPKVLSEVSKFDNLLFSGVYIN